MKAAFEPCRPPRILLTVGRGGEEQSVLCMFSPGTARGWVDCISTARA